VIFCVPYCVLLLLQSSTACSEMNDARARKVHPKLENEKQFHRCRGKADTTNNVAEASGSHALAVTDIQVRWLRLQLSLPSCPDYKTSQYHVRQIARSRVPTSLQQEGRGVVQKISTIKVNAVSFIDGELPTAAFNVAGVTCLRHIPRRL